MLIMKTSCPSEFTFLPRKRSSVSVSHSLNYKFNLENLRLRRRNLRLDAHDSYSLLTRWRLKRKSTPKRLETKRRNKTKGNTYHDQIATSVDLIQRRNQYYSVRLPITLFGKPNLVDSNEQTPTTTRDVFTSSKNRTK